ncbi:MAG: hypothetical protein AUK63_717 [bacterium P3]|nr:MAG: hypothetical protein AUK63_717 [bacterium P3]KWW42200.1 MAG: hypothetical protein F083_539 [bacterium F083]
MPSDLDRIHLHGHQFRRYLTHDDIAAAVQQVAEKLNRDYRDKSPLLCPVLTGSYVFAADLSRAMSVDHEIAFVQYNSYQGMASTGRVNARLPFDSRCQGRHVIIVEDIVESGTCMAAMLDRLKQLQPASVAICTLLFKPNRFDKKFTIDYIGFSIPDDFIVGYGLDFDGAGRHYADIYILDE